MYATFIVFLLLRIVSAERYAVVIAPRDNWFDYGVQSESCRMYKDLVAGGVKPENIILMSTTKVSDDPYNPFPGELFTDDSPDAPGKDYAHGCLEYIDYDENDMTVDVFLSILTGNNEVVKEITGKENPKVLRSGPDDEVMMYITSHGGQGHVVIGYTYITERQLLDTITYMNHHKMYKHFLILLEACYSGSMFRNLPAGLNVYAITAADADHESFESHCPPDDKIDGKSLDTCLSCWWDNAMEWFMEGGADHTLDELYEHTHEKVAEQTIQNVCHFGDIEEMGKMTLREFMGDLPANRFRSYRNDDSVKVAKADVPMHLAKWKAIRADQYQIETVLKEYQEITFETAKKEIEIMRLGNKLMSEKAANKALKTVAESYSASCVSELSEQLISKCGHSYPFSKSAINMLKNICRPGVAVPIVDFADICV